VKEYIYVKGAREHNLKNIDLAVPRDKLVSSSLIGRMKFKAFHNIFLHDYISRLHLFS
jgi:excinuclease UvrABC ATPase subunit